ncbi:thioredoxin family protein [Runella sp.]|uniref:thioredoxin family protein n=1 Tax=Runella sp. TaxID=1960881 RepID=UPI003D115B8B
MKTIISLFIAGLLFSAPQWGGNFEKAKAEAAQNNKYILLNFCGSDWCGPCIKLKKDIFESEDFQQYAEGHLVLVRADFPRQKKNQLETAQTAHNEALAEKYNPQGKFPFTLLLDANGKVLKEWEGYPKTLNTLAFVHDIALVANAGK